MFKHGDDSHQMTSKKYTITTRQMIVMNSKNTMIKGKKFLLHVA